MAAKLNGYLVGVCGVEQFDQESEILGLTEKQIAYVRRYVEENEGGGIFCWRKAGSCFVTHNIRKKKYTN